MLDGSLFVTLGESCRGPHQCDRTKAESSNLASREKREAHHCSRVMTGETP